MIYHGEPAFTDLAPTVRRAAAKLREARQAHPFDSIAVTGMSGVVVGSPVALRLRVPLVVVRKDTDRCHSDITVINADRAGQRALFLDDFVCVGTSRQRVRRALAAYTHAELTAQYMYADHTFEPLTSFQAAVDASGEPMPVDKPPAAEPPSVAFEPLDGQWPLTFTPKDMTFTCAWDSVGWSTIGFLDASASAA